MMCIHQRHQPRMKKPRLGRGSHEVRHATADDGVAIALILAACTGNPHQCPALRAYNCQDSEGLEVCAENWFDPSLWDWTAVYCAYNGDGTQPLNCPVVSLGPVYCLSGHCLCGTPISPVPGG